LDPENLTFGIFFRLDQELHRIDFCNIRSIYASRKYHLEARKRWTFSGTIPGLVPIDGGDRKRGDSGEECRAANVGGDGVRDNLVAPRVLQGSDALKGDVEAPGENRISVRMTTRRFKPTEVAIGELAGYRLVVWRVGDVGFDAAEKV